MAFLVFLFLFCFSRASTAFGYSVHSRLVASHLTNGEPKKRKRSRLWSVSVCYREIRAFSISFSRFLSCFISFQLICRFILSLSNTFALFSTFSSSFCLFSTLSQLILSVFQLSLPSLFNSFLAFSTHFVSSSAFSIHSLSFTHFSRSPFKPILSLFNDLLLLLLLAFSPSLYPRFNSFFSFFRLFIQRSVLILFAPPHLLLDMILLSIPDLIHILRSLTHAHIRNSEKYTENWIQIQWNNKKLILSAKSATINGLICYTKKSVSAGHCIWHMLAIAHVIEIWMEILNYGFWATTKSFEFFDWIFARDQRLLAVVVVHVFKNFFSCQPRLLCISAVFWLEKSNRSNVSISMEFFFTLAKFEHFSIYHRWQESHLFR